MKLLDFTIALNLKKVLKSQFEKGFKIKFNLAQLSLGTSKNINLVLG